MAMTVTRRSNNGHDGAVVRGKTRVDPQRDPPPDLVVEIDMTHSTLAKLTLYAQFGVPEVWRYVDGRMEILTLEGDDYRPLPQSRVVPLVTAAALTTLVHAGAGKSQGEWWRLVRAWAGEKSNEEQPGARRVVEHGESRRALR